MTIGTSFNSTFWLNSEPCGFICGMMTWVLVIFGMYVVSYKIIEPWLGFQSLRGMFHMVIFNTLCILTMYTHWKAMTTDPGAVPKDARPLPTDDQEFDPEAAASRSTPYKKFCRRCKAFKPKRAHHCSICERCIVKMDHHCPWVNNCVGIGNTKLFVQFLLLIFVLSAYAIALLILKALNCSMSRKSKHFCPSSPGDAVFLVALLVEGILFGLFTLCMLADQSETISSNQTQIDRLKNVRHDFQDEINEVFGTPSNYKFHVSWLLPTQAKFPTHFRDKIYGFILPQVSEADRLGSSNTELTPLQTKSNESTEQSEDISIFNREGRDLDVKQGDSNSFHHQASMRKRVNTPENSASN